MLINVDGVGLLAACGPDPRVAFYEWGCKALTDVTADTHPARGLCAHVVKLQANVFQVNSHEQHMLQDRRYAFWVSANVGTGSAQQQMDIRVNAPPYGGEVVVSPSTGIAQQQMFRISALDWVDGDLPLRYQYEIAGRQPQQGSAAFLLTPNSTMQSDLFTPLPYLSSNGAHQVFGYISDGLGSQTNTKKLCVIEIEKCHAAQVELEEVERPTIVAAVAGVDKFDKNIEALDPAEATLEVVRHTRALYRSLGVVSNESTAQHQLAVPVVASLTQLDKAVRYLANQTLGQGQDDTRLQTNYLGMLENIVAIPVQRRAENTTEQIRHVAQQVMRTATQVILSAHEDAPLAEAQATLFRSGVTLLDAASFAGGTESEADAKPTLEYDSLRPFVNGLCDVMTARGQAHSAASRLADLGVTCGVKYQRSAAATLNPSKALSVGVVAPILPDNTPVARVTLSANLPTTVRPSVTFVQGRASVLVPDIAACVAQGGQLQEGACVGSRRMLQGNEPGHNSAASLSASRLELDLTGLDASLCAQRFEISLVLASGNGPCSAQHSGDSTECQRTYDALRDARREMRHSGAKVSSANVLTHVIMRASRDDRHAQKLNLVGYFSTNACLGHRDVGEVSVSGASAASKVVVSAVSCVGGKLECGSLPIIKDRSLVRINNPVGAHLHFERYFAQPGFLVVISAILTAVFVLVVSAMLLDYCAYRHKRDEARQILFECYGQVDKCVNTWMH